jgi:hypothetical protein
VSDIIVEGAVAMSLQTVMAGVGSLATEMSALRGDVSRALTRIEVGEERHAAAALAVSDHEARIRAIESTAPREHVREIVQLQARIMRLERFRYTLAGAMLALQVLISVAAVLAVQL